MAVLQTATASTVAHWRFEEGPVAFGMEPKSDVVLDSSGNGNHLRTHADYTSPAYFTDIPFHPVPQTLKSNHLSLRFLPNQDLFTLWKPIDKKRFSQWTIEASFKPHATNGYHAILGKDGKPLAGGLPPISLKIHKNSRRLEMGIVDGSEVFRSLMSLGSLQANRWYSAAATATATEMTLWLRAPDETEYQLQGRIPISGAMHFPQNGFSRPWTVGRGSWNNQPADWFDGLIDEVRISDTVLSPAEFLASPGPGTPPVTLAPRMILAPFNHLDHTRHHLALEAAAPGPMGSLSLQGSSDLQSWEPINFTTEAAAPSASSPTQERVRLVTSLEAETESRYFLQPTMTVETPPETTPTNPILQGADPDALLIEDTVWVYPTQRSGKGLFYAHSSKDLVNWEIHGPILQFSEISWIPEGKHAWAPGIAAKNGKFYLYYSVGPKPSHIGVAVANSPAGPFVDSGQALLSDNGNPSFEAIDAMVFTDPVSGKSYFYAGGSAGAKLRIFELKENMISFAREISVTTPPNFTEGPFMHLREGVYYLSYSHGRWNDASYAVHYATSSSPTGPWSYQGKILGNDASHKGPGHHSIVHNPHEDAWYIFYHRWNNKSSAGPFSGHRFTAVDLLEYDSQGKIVPVIMTDTGVGPVRLDTSPTP